MVLDHLVRMENVGTDLRAPFDLALVGVGGVLQLFPPADLLFIETRFQHGQRLLPVLALGAALLAFDDNAGWNVASNVPLLPPCSRSARLYRRNGRIPIPGLRGSRSPRWYRPPAGTRNTEAKEVCLRALESNGEMRTRR